MKLHKHLIVLSFLAALTSCYPEEEYLDASDLDTVVTFEPASADFSNKTTFAVSETVWDDSYDGYDGNYNTALVAQIEKNMTDLGYQLVTNPATSTPDIVIVPEIIFYDNYVIGGGGCYYGCWGWDCFDCWWGYYPPYYPPSYVVSYSTGSILLHMIDPTVNGDQDVNILWLGAIDGLLRNSLSHAELNRHVDQAFNQSADYLSK